MTTNQLYKRVTDLMIACIIVVTSVTLMSCDEVGLDGEDKTLDANTEEMDALPEGYYVRLMSPASTFGDISPIRGVVKVDDYVYAALRPGIAHNGGLLIFDVSDLESLDGQELQPIVNNEYPGLGTGIAKKDNYLFLGGNRTKMFDVSDPTQPVELGELGPSNEGIKVAGDYIILNAYHRLTIFDITTPNQPIPLNIFGADIYSADIENTLLVVGTTETVAGISTMQVRIYDVDALEEGAEPASMSMGEGWMYETEVVGDALYVLTEEPGSGSGTYVTHFYKYSLGDILENGSSSHWIDHVAYEDSDVRRAMGASDTYVVVSGYGGYTVMAHTDTGPLTVVESMVSHDLDGKTPDGFLWYADIVGNEIVLPGASFALIHEIVD